MSVEEVSENSETPTAPVDESNEITGGPLEDKYGGDVGKLEKAYTSAEQKIVKQAQEISELKKTQSQSEPEVKEETEGKTEEPKSEEESKSEESTPDNYEQVVETYGQGMADIFKAADMDPFMEWDHFDKEGALTDEGYEKLEKVGYDKATVNTYLAGYAEQRDSNINNVIETLGGQEQVAKLQKWISNTWTHEQQTEHNEILQSNDFERINEHVSVIKERYAQVYGSQPEVTVKGAPTPLSGDVYKDTYSMKKDMNDPRYKSSEEFRNKVQEKLLRSDLFGKYNQ